MRHSSVLFAGLAFVAVAAGNPLAQSSDSTLPIFVDYVSPPPERLAQLAAAADGVVVVRVDSVTFESPIDQRSQRARDLTNYSLHIVATLKPHAMLPPNEGTLQLSRAGGQHAEGGRIVRSAVQGFEEFRTSGEYVLFLNWNQRIGAFDIAYGPNGSYELLLSGSVRPLGQATVALAQAGKGRQAFLQELRLASAR